MDNMNNEFNIDMYMEWLEEYTNEHTHIYSVYSAVLACEKTKDMVRGLDILYEEMNLYIMNKYQLPVLSIDGSYLLKYNDNYYMIGNDGECTYCVKRDNIEEELFIDYSDIREYFLDNKKIGYIRKLKR